MADFDVLITSHQGLYLTYKPLQWIRTLNSSHLKGFTNIQHIYMNSYDPLKIAKIGHFGKTWVYPLCEKI